MAEFAKRNPNNFNLWHTLSSYIVVLSVRDLRELHELRSSMLSNQITIFEFYEPDISNELTAFTIDPIQYQQARKLVSHIPLAFSESHRDEIVLHYNKKHNEDASVPMWTIKHKGHTYYVNHVEIKNKSFSTKETPTNPHTKGSLKFRGKLTIEGLAATIS